MTLDAILDRNGPSSEKREAARRTLRLGAAGRRTSGQATHVRIHDLSAGGMLIESSESLEIGETITVELPRSAPRQASVVWSSSQFYGCRLAEPLAAATLSAALLQAEPAAPATPRPAPAPASFSARLAALRKARGWTMEQLARRLNVSRQSVWYWETGQRLPKPAALATIANEFGVSEQELLAPPESPTDAADSVQRCKMLLADRFGIAADKVTILLEL